MALRLPSVVAAVIGVVLLFGLVRELFNARVALFASGLYAVNPFVSRNWAGEDWRAATAFVMQQGGVAAVYPEWAAATEALVVGPPGYRCALDPRGRPRRPVIA